jgi:FdhE protein
MTTGDSATRTTRLLDPEQIAILAGRQMPFLRLPERATVFAERQLRLRRLAASHPMRDYLLFIAGLAQAQHESLQGYAPLTLPDSAACDAAAHALRAPLPAESWPRDPAWRSETRRLLGRFQSGLAAGPARDSVQRVIEADEAFYEHQADRLLNGISLGLDLAAAPLIAAGLQTYWTSLVLQTAATHGASVFGRTERATACPCCASLPTASITRIGADESGFRYLHCSLCSSQWHFVRIKCAHCESTKGVHYEQLEAVAGTAPPLTGARVGAIRAECCDHCGHYLKLVAMESDHEVEPVADDLASVALDLLVSDAGHQRAGVNLMLVFGDPEPA